MDLFLKFKRKVLYKDYLLDYFYECIHMFTPLAEIRAVSKD